MSYQEEYASGMYATRNTYIAGPREGLRGNWRQDKAIEKKIYKSKNFKLYKERKQNKTAITKKKTIRKEKN